MKLIFRIFQLFLCYGLVLPIFAQTDPDCQVCANETECEGVFDCKDYMIDDNLNDDARLMVSAFHQTIVKTSKGFYVFGENTSPSDTQISKNLYEPTFIHPTKGFNYCGTPLDATIASSGTEAQGVLLTTEGLYVWGKNGVIYNKEDNDSREMTQVPLPLDVEPVDIKRVEASRKILTLLLKNGTAYVYLNKYVDGNNNLNVSSSMYGDGTIPIPDNSSIDNEWHKVGGQNVDYDFLFLKHSNKAFFAYTRDGKYYTWGEKVYTGNSASSPQSDINLPLEMTPPYLATDPPKMILINASGSYFVLNSVDKKIYSMGSNAMGILGRSVDANEIKDWGIVQVANNEVEQGSSPTKDLENVIFISTSSRSISSTLTPTAGAITSDRTLYLWGSNDGYIISDSAPDQAANPFSKIPIIPSGFVVGENKAMFVENGGHITPYYDSRYRKFGYVGHCHNGSMGVRTCIENYIKQYDFRNTPQVDFCAELPEVIQSIRTNPRLSQILQTPN